MREDTVFEPLSMTKPVFAYAVMRPADEQRLDLDAPLVAIAGPTICASAT